MPDPGTPTNAGTLARRDAQAMMRYDANKRSAGVAYLLLFVLGGFGAHRFYLKRTKSAFAMLAVVAVSVALLWVGIGYLGAVVLCTWELVDLFLIPGMTRDYNNKLIANLEKP